MTKVIILGENKPEVKLKRIQLMQSLTTEYTFFEASDRPENWNFIELVCRDYTKGVDLMFAYDDDRNTGCLYIGKFNDGIV